MTKVEMFNEVFEGLKLRNSEKQERSKAVNKRSKEYIEKCYNFYLNEKEEAVNTNNLDSLKMFVVLCMTGLEGK